MFPDDPDPAKQITLCPQCNAEIGQQNGVFNCPKHGMVTPIMGDNYERKVPEEGKRPKGFGPEHTYVNPAIPFNRAASKSKDHLKRNKKNEDLAEHSDDTVKDLFEAEMAMCSKPPKRKNEDYDDKLAVMRSCNDLAIDG